MTPAHKHPLFAEFNRSHTALWLFRKGRTYAEYLPYLRRANNDARLWTVMLRNWGDPVC
jgi:hypothetical protein